MRPLLESGGKPAARFRCLFARSGFFKLNSLFLGLSLALFRRYNYKIMTLKNLNLLTALAVFTLLSSCTKEYIKGNGSIISEKRDATGFTEIISSAHADVLVVYDQKFEVTVQGPSNVLPYVETKVVNGQLQLGIKNYVSVKDAKLIFTVHAPLVNALTLSGSGNIQAEGKFPYTQAVKIALYGSGNIAWQRGSCNQLSATITGSGNIDAGDLDAADVSAGISGSGSIKVSASKTLSASISGSGKINYKGDAVVSSRITGSGAVTKY